MQTPSVAQTTARTPGTEQFVYKVELANKFRAGQAVGTLWGVGKYLQDGRRFGCYVLDPQESEQFARNFCAILTEQDRAALAKAGVL